MYTQTKYSGTGFFRRGETLIRGMHCTSACGLVGTIYKNINSTSQIAGAYYKQITSKNQVSIGKDKYYDSNKEEIIDNR